MINCNLYVSFHLEKYCYLGQKKQMNRILRQKFASRLNMIQTKIKEIRNKSILVPRKIRYIYANIYNINIFSIIKKIKNAKRLFNTIKRCYKSYKIY